MSIKLLFFTIVKMNTLKLESLLDDLPFRNTKELVEIRLLLNG